MIVVFISGCCSFSLYHNPSRAESDFKKADSLYRTGDHWNASFDFQEFVAKDQDSALTQKALLYQGLCYDSLNLYDIAKTIYRSGLDRFPRSKFMLIYHTGIMSADYAMEYYDSVCIRYDSLEKAGAELQPDAKLVKGKALYKMKKFGEAKKLLEQIVKLEDFRCAAGAIIGLCCIKLKEDTLAMNRLKEVVEACSSSAPEACLNLGHFYFEKGDSISAAINYYNMIPDSSIHYEMVLVALGWSYLKINKAKKTDSCSDVFISRYPESPFLGEIHLLKGYALLILKHKDKAYKTLDQCLDVMKKWETDSIINKKLINALNHQIQLSGDFLKKRITDSSIAFNVERKSELYKRYSILEYKTILLRKEKNTAENIRLNSHRKNEIIADAEYAFAAPRFYPPTVEQRRQTGEEKKRVEEERKKIEEELRRLEESKINNPQ